MIHATFLIFLLLCWCGCDTLTSDKNAGTVVSLIQANFIIYFLTMQHCPTLDIFILHLYFDLTLDKMFKIFSKSTSGSEDAHFTFDTKTFFFWWWSGVGVEETY